VHREEQPLLSNLVQRVVEKQEQWAYRKEQPLLNSLVQHVAEKQEQFQHRLKTLVPPVQQPKKLKKPVQLAEER